MSPTPAPRWLRAAREAGASVEVVPGPAAVTAAVALSGVEAPGFVFGGFLPSRPASARAKALDRLLDAAVSAELPLVLYEAPHRMASLLAALDERVPAATVAAARELTKRHEEVLVGTAAEVASRLDSPRGEFTVVVSGLPPAAREGNAPDAEALLEAGRREGLSDRTLLALLRAIGLSRRDAYRLIEAHRSG